MKVYVGRMLARRIRRPAVIVKSIAYLTHPNVQDHTV